MLQYNVIIVATLITGEQKMSNEQKQHKIVNVSLSIVLFNKVSLLAKQNKRSIRAQVAFMIEQYFVSGNYEDVA